MSCAHLTNQDIVIETFIDFFFCVVVVVTVYHITGEEALA